MKRIIITLSLISAIFAKDYLFLNTYSNISNTGILDQNDLESIDILFEEELTKYTFGNITHSSKSCPDNECALEELSNSEHEFIVYTRVIKLGEKLRYSGTILDNEGVVFSTKIIVTNATEMEEGVMRLVKSLALQENIDEVADIENIVPSESVESDRIKSFYKTGFSVGYMYPLGDSYLTRDYNDYYWGDDEGEWTYTNQTQKIKISALYLYDFKDNASLLIDGVGYFGTTPSFGISANYLKYHNKGNNSPFYGGGVGIQWVPWCTGYDCEESMPTDHRRSGVSLNGQTGFMLFRTYDINLMVRLQYHIVLNSDLDQGIVMDVGVIRKPKPKSESTRSPMQKLATSIGNTYLFFIAMGIIGMMAN